MDALTTASDVFVYRLNVLLAMERDAGALAAACVRILAEDSGDGVIGDRARAVADRSRTIEEVFSLTGLVPEPVSAPLTLALIEDTTRLLKASDETIRADVALAAMLTMEGVIAAAYDVLAVTVRHLGATDVMMRLDDGLAHCGEMAQALRDALGAVITQPRPGA